MGVKQGDRWRGEFWIFKLSNPLLQASNSFTKDLRPCFSFPVVIFATLSFLSTKTLLTARFSTITSLDSLSVNIVEHDTDAKRHYHLPLSDTLKIKS
jgi:hypothetical protein